MAERQTVEKPITTEHEQSDPVNPPYYTSVAKIECIDVVEHLSFNAGNAIKYIWRHKDKGGVVDLKKAVWYVQREIARLEKIHASIEPAPAGSASVAAPTAQAEIDQYKAAQASGLQTMADWQKGKK